MLRPSALHFVLSLSVEGRLRLEEMVNLSFDFAQDSEDVRLSGSTVPSGSPSKDSVEALVELLNHI
ncbi:MAG TPA: hypothetical protein VGB16_04120, partial [candidate division Zixibacteria bacterium]